MNIATVENIVMLLSAVTGLFISVFRYIETPKRGWLYVTGFFLAHFLSDYYWAAYTFIIHDDPDVSALMAYFGWNVAFALLMAAAIHMRDPASKKLFHPLVFLPIPLNIAQVILYLQYGGYFNNIWQGTCLTIAECVCVQSLLYYAKNRKEGAKLPLFNTLALSYILMEFSMWTISCFHYPDWKLDPYYVLEFAGYITIVFLAEAVGRDYRNRGVVTGRMTVNGMRLRMLLQITASIIIFGGCIGGLQIASWMKDSIPEGAEDGYGSIAVTLFVISVVLAALIGILMFFISVRYKKMRSVENEDDMRSSRTGFITTVILSFVLMCISVIFTSRLIYRVSVDGVRESGEDTTRLVAAEIENHLAAASAALEVTSDTVETMMKRGESQEKLLIFLTDQTDNQKKFFEDDMTGLYGLIRGEYMDGLGWEPPEGYDPTTRD
ncbi:MAG: hypothetical protein IJS86_05090 [Lachnospiraceae bacterium]|nr:hypothetical protein [Lachnospiraceae bacterium]